MQSRLRENFYFPVISAHFLSFSLGGRGVAEVGRAVIGVIAGLSPGVLGHWLSQGLSRGLGFECNVQMFYNI